MSNSLWILLLPFTLTPCLNPTFDFYHTSLFFSHLPLSPLLITLNNTVTILPYGSCNRLSSISRLTGVNQGGRLMREKGEGEEPNRKDNEEEDRDEKHRKIAKRKCNGKGERQRRKTKRTWINKEEEH